MAPVATTDNDHAQPVTNLKEESKVFNPFYSPSIGDDGDETYKYAQFKVSTVSFSLVARRRDWMDAAFLP